MIIDKGQMNRSHRGELMIEGNSNELKGDEKYQDIPIIMLTAVADHVGSTRYSHADGMSMEADDYLPKPASAEQITNSVKALI